MTDKERILSAVISQIMPELLYADIEDREKYFKNCMLEPSKLSKGDLVVASTTIIPNDYSVGFVHEIKDNCVVIRKIGGEKLCNYYNEGFYKINKEELGYEVLEGLQYRTYLKVLKAFGYTGYSTRFKSISFKENKCTVQARNVFEDDLFFEVNFEFSSKTTISEIGEILRKEEEKMRHIEKKESD